MKVLLTGGAGFIGSHLATAYVANPNITLVRIIDNLSTGSRSKLEHLRDNRKLEFVDGDISDYNTCLKVCNGIDVISHQAALGSVPRSIGDPLTTNKNNITGSLNIFWAAKVQCVSRIVFAASSSTYGDSDVLPKREGVIGKPMSPYAVTKLVNELYADVFARVYNIEFIGLRYFNIFGPGQDHDNPYAAVIPKFCTAILSGESPYVNGDGFTSRDFTYIDNVVKANQLALFTSDSHAINQIYNIACGNRTTLNDIIHIINEIANSNIPAIYGPTRLGDIRHSHADISKAKRLLGYDPKIQIREGLKLSLPYYS